MDSAFDITGVPEGDDAPQELEVPEVDDNNGAEVSEPQDESTFGLIGANAKYVVYCLQELRDAALSNDCGWIGIDDETMSAFPAENPDYHTVIVFVVPKRKLVIGYGVILGAAETVEELKFSMKRELPPCWKNVIRVAWVRSSEVPFTSLTGGESEVVHAAAACFVENEMSKLTEISRADAKALTNAVEDAAKLRLPRDIRNTVGTLGYGKDAQTVNDQRRNSTFAGAPGRQQFQRQHRNYQAQPAVNNGWDEVPSAMTMHHQHQQQQQQQVLPIPQQGVPAPEVQAAQPDAQAQAMQIPDVSQFPDYESYVKYQQEMEEYQKAMAVYNAQMAQLQQAQQAQQQVMPMSSAVEGEQQGSAPTPAPAGNGGQDGW